MTSGRGFAALGVERLDLWGNSYGAYLHDGAQQRLSARRTVAL